MTHIVTFSPAPLLAMFEGRTAAEIAAAIGVQRSTVCAWRLGRKGIAWWNADRIAVHLGLHPSAIWPDWYERAA